MRPPGSRAAFLTGALLVTALLPALPVSPAVRSRSRATRSRRSTTSAIVPLPFDGLARRAPLDGRPEAHLKIASGWNGRPSASPSRWRWTTRTGGRARRGLQRRHLDRRRTVRPGHHGPHDRCADGDGDRRPADKGGRRRAPRGRRCRRDAAHHQPGRVGRQRVVSLQLRRLRDLARPSSRRCRRRSSTTRRAEQRPEPGGDDPRDLLHARDQSRLWGHRLQLPDRRAGPDLRGPALPRLRLGRGDTGEDLAGNVVRGRPRPRLQRRHRRDRPPRQLPEPPAADGPQRAGEADRVEAGAPRPQPARREHVHEPDPRQPQVPQQHLRPPQREPDRLPGRGLLPTGSRPCARTSPIGSPRPPAPTTTTRRPRGLALPMVPTTTGATTMPFGLVFKEPVDGLRRTTSRSAARHRAGRSNASRARPRRTP